jgi:uncharacterized protein
MENKYVHLLAMNLNLVPWQVENTLKLFESKATTPFISRYRKEVTGSLDEVQIGEIKDLYNRYDELDKRRDYIIKSISDQGQLTETLRDKLNGCYTLTELEDLYLPYKQKKKTRASVAREKGLEPLAMVVFRQQERDPEGAAESFLNDNVGDINEALQGARDIIAEWINENQDARKTVRKAYAGEAVVASKVIKGKEQEGIKYSDYYDFSEPLSRCPSHRLMAMLRGEDEGLLRLTIEPAEEKVLASLEKQFIRSSGECAQQLTLAIKDSYKRLLSPSIETEFRALAKGKADDQAIRVFAENLKQLFMAPLL